MFNTNIIDQIQKYQVTPIQMLNSKSLCKYTLQNSIQNIRKQQKKQYLNILITNIEYLELFGNCLSFCKIGIIGITLQQKKILAQFYSNKVLIIDQSISNSYIDIIITENKDLLNILIHKNYIKYIYAINNKFILQYYKMYQSSLPNSYFYINRLGVDAYKQLQFKLDIVQNKQENIIIKQKKQIKLINEQQNKSNIKEKIQNKQQYLSDKNTVSLIIPFYNNSKPTIKLIRTLQRYSKNTNFKINAILISDGSKQDIILNISNQLKKCKNIKYQIIINQKRIGYIKSTNLGISKALQNQSQYIILMHNDIEVSYNWQDLLLNINGSIIGTCPITNSIYDEKQSIKYIRSNNILKDFPQSFQKCKTLTINEMLAKYKNTNIQLSKQTFIPNFFCMAFNASIFKQIGLLDQSFGQGFGQNIDFIYKIYNAGYKINFMPSVYIPHIGRTTFKDIYPQKQFEQQIIIRQNLNKFAINLNNNKVKKKVIYTCVTNNYDTVKHSVYNTQQFDYILFGQNLQNIQKPWIYIDISNFKNNIKTDNHIKIARFFKTHPHLFFRNYQESIWVDGNIDIISNPSNFSELLLDDEYLLIPKHPKHKSVYAEAQVCKVMEKDTTINIDKMIKFLNQNNFKDNTPLVQSCIIIRKHNNINCIKLMENWWKLIFKYTYRDQLSFNYCLQKSNQNIILIDWNIINNKYIKWNGKHENNK